MAISRTIPNLEVPFDPRPEPIIPPVFVIPPTGRIITIPGFPDRVNLLELRRLKAKAAEAAAKADADAAAAATQAAADKAAADAAAAAEAQRLADLAAQATAEGDAAKAKAAADASAALSASVNGGIPTWALWAGGAAAFWFLFMRKGR